MKLTLMLSILAVANAYCPNGCSGHGSCGANGESAYIMCGAQGHIRS